jgi:hypothetical protein
MKPRIKIEGERVFSTRSSTTIIEATKYHQKVRHLRKYLTNLVLIMGLSQTKTE